VGQLADRGVFVGGEHGGYLRLLLRDGEVFVLGAQKERARRYKNIIVQAAGIFNILPEKTKAGPRFTKAGTDAIMSKEPVFFRDCTRKNHTER
jgi:hypothetical protein